MLGNGFGADNAAWQAEVFIGNRRLGGGASGLIVALIRSSGLLRRIIIAELFVPGCDHALIVLGVLQVVLGENPVDEHNHALGALRYLVSRIDSRFIEQYYYKIGLENGDFLMANEYMTNSGRYLTQEELNAADPKKYARWFKPRLFTETGSCRFKGRN